MTEGKWDSQRSKFDRVPRVLVKAKKVRVMKILMCLGGNTAPVDQVTHSPDGRVESGVMLFGEVCEGIEGVSLRASTLPPDGATNPLADVAREAILLRKRGSPKGSPGSGCSGE